MNILNMKKISYFFICVTSLLITCISCQKVGYVNPNKMTQGYHGFKAQQLIYSDKVRNWQQHIDSLNSELQAQNKSHAANLTTKEQQLLRYRNAIQQQAQQENQLLTKAVLEEINAYLKQYGKNHGYTFILGATESGNIVYAAEGTDITEDALKGINAQYDRQHPSSAR